MPQLSPHNLLTLVILFHFLYLLLITFHSYPSYTPKVTKYKNKNMSSLLYM